MTRQSVLFGVGLIVLAGAVGSPVLSTMPADAGVHDWEWPWEDNDVDVSDVSVSSTAAFETAIDETDQKPVELDLGTSDGTPTYNILTAGSDGTTRVIVDATNGTVLETSTLDVKEPKALKRVNLSNLRSATEVVELAQEEANGTVTDVELQRHKGPVFYEVKLETEAGTETTVYVAPTESPILGVQTKDDKYH